MRIAKYGGITGFETRRERIKSFKWFNLAKGEIFPKFCLQMKWKFELRSQFLNGTISQFVRSVVPISKPVT